MQLFKGLEHTDYQDILRAIGWMIDHRGYANIRLIEHENGLIFQARQYQSGSVSYQRQTRLMTDGDVEELLRTAYTRRGEAQPARMQPGYQEVLRAVGLFLDQHRYGDIRLIEYEHGLILQVRRRGGGLGTNQYETIVLTGREIARLLEFMVARRGHGRVELSVIPPDIWPTPRQGIEAIARFGRIARASSRQPA
jgi:hypothetical protein